MTSHLDYVLAIDLPIAVDLFQRLSLLDLLRSMGVMPETNSEITCAGIE